jgi:hypothetical protein
MYDEHTELKKELEICRPFHNTQNTKNGGHFIVYPHRNLMSVILKITCRLYILRKIIHSGNIAYEV